MLGIVAHFQGCVYKKFAKNVLRGNKKPSRCGEGFLFCLRQERRPCWVGAFARGHNHSLVVTGEVD